MQNIAERFRAGAAGASGHGGNRFVKSEHTLVLLKGFTWDTSSNLNTEGTAAGFTSPDGGDWPGPQRRWSGCKKNDADFGTSGNTWRTPVSAGVWETLREAIASSRAGGYGSSFSISCSWWEYVLRCSESCCPVMSYSLNAHQQKTFSTYKNKVSCSSRCQRVVATSVIATFKYTLGWVVFPLL